MAAMTSVQAFFKEASSVQRDELAAALPEEVVITFEIAGLNGGVWTVTTEGASFEVQERRSRLADCRISCSADDFRALVTGRLDRYHAFASGKITVEGDVGLVLRLARVVIGDICS